MHHSFYAEAKVFRQAVDAFRQVLQKHTAALRAGHLHDIWQWQEERNGAYRKLQKTLERLISRLRNSSCSDRDATLRGVRKVVAELMEEETVLQGAVEQQRGEVLKGLRKLRCGKRSLLAYRSAASGNARSRFLNSES